MPKGSSGKGGRYEKAPHFRKNAANPVERLFNRQAEVVAELQSLRAGLPIAEAKAKTPSDRIDIRRKYNARIAELKKKASDINKMMTDEVRKQTNTRT